LIWFVIFSSNTAVALYNSRTLNLTTGTYGILTVSCFVRQWHSVGYCLQRKKLDLQMIVQRSSQGNISRWMGWKKFQINPSIHKGTSP